MRQCAASNSDLFKGWDIAKISRTVGNKRYMKQNYSVHNSPGLSGHSAF